MVGCENEGVDHAQVGLHLLRVEHVFGDEMALPSEGGGVAHEEVAS